MNPFPLFILLFGCATVLVISAGCRDGGAAPPQTGLRTVSMTIGGKPFTLEVADDDRSREIGLMNRDSMPADHGMIFPFAREEPRGFWMKNTRIPLDILYLDSSGRVVSVHTMAPYDLRTTNSAGPAKYVIELNAGVAAKLGIKAGDKLEVPPSAVSRDGL
jgi:uncharacterized membrane protein (UPF0127 family)